MANIKRLGGYDAIAAVVDDFVRRQAGGVAWVAIGVRVGTAGSTLRRGKIHPPIGLAPGGPSCFSAAGAAGGVP